MALSGNKGEWSEIYVFLRLLAEGRLFAADEQQNRIKNVFLPIIKILREETAGSKYEYRLNQETSEVVIFLNGKKIFSLPVKIFNDEAERLFSDIYRCGTGEGAFEIPGTETFIKSIFINKLKAPSKDKSDITIQIHDINTGFENIVGFSIKSDLGSPPTLLNASKSTNFIFEVKGLPEAEIPVINSIDKDTTKTKIIDRINAIKHKGGELVFEKIASKKFEQNLIMIDSQMAIIAAEMLKVFYCKHIIKCSQLAEEVIKINPLNQRKEFYIHKIKELLCASALGMKPATVWDGKEEANGGYIIVKKDGVIVAYHIYNRNLFTDYLFQNTQLVQPGTTKNDYCLLYKENGNIYIKLNLQIRFI